MVYLPNRPIACRTNPFEKSRADSATFLVEKSAAAFVRPRLNNTATGCGSITREEEFLP